MTETLYGQCRRCKGVKAPSKARLCDSCLPVIETRTRTYTRCGICRQEKPRTSQRFCEGCSATPERRAYQAEAGRRWKSKNPEQVAAHQAAQRRRRELVIAHYGGKCACCGEARHEFLQIDHIHGDGRRHRGTNIISWLLRNMLPGGFRVLCANCNFAIAKYPHCPHNPAIRTERKVIAITEARREA